MQANAAAMAMGVVLGSAVACLQPHPRRRLGVSALGALLCAAVVPWLGFGDFRNEVAYVLLGVGAAIGFPPATHALPGYWNFFERFVWTGLQVFLLWFGFGVWIAPRPVEPQTIHFLVAVTCSCILALGTLYYFRREVFEQLLEFPFFFMYRFRAAGPGLDCFPLRGPVLVVANHSAWMDPLWLGKVLPRRLIPMMTSLFFDLTGMRFLMKHVFHAIRVQESRYRRDVPELQQAIDALDRDECVVIFPEGGMRRKEERPLKMFGQGVWHILKERPDTPVVVCWIEGGWGSFFSYFSGPPTKNKRFDRRRLIQVAIAEPQFVDPEVLADQRGTRLYLMEQCVAQRRHLGLEVPRLAQIEDEEEGEAPAKE
jgi:1-acyl-sn-glycerol-3-phosphate acyltransferase